MKAKMLLGLMAFHCASALCFEITGSYIAGDLRWQSVPVAQGIVPAYWNVTMGQPSAQKVIPGGVEKIEEIPLQLTAEGGDYLIDTKVSVVGIQYQLAKNVAASEHNGRANTVSAGKIVTVMGSGEGDTLFDFGALTQTPFTHFRPIIKLDESLKSQFTDDLPVKYFIGQFTAKLLYDYYVDDVKIRQYVSFPVTLKIFHWKEQKIKIEVIGEDDIKPLYFANAVFGKTTYQIKMTYENGDEPSADAKFFMLLHSSKSMDERFYLVEQAPQMNEEAKKIPFGVFCGECQANNGWLINLDGQSSVINKMIEVRRSSFNLDVSFENAPLDKLNQGTYQGNFSVLIASEL